MPRGARHVAVADRKPEDVDTMHREFVAIMDAAKARGRALTDDIDDHVTLYFRTPVTNTDERARLSQIIMEKRAAYAEAMRETEHGGRELLAAWLDPTDKPEWRAKGEKVKRFTASFKRADAAYTRGTKRKSTVPADWRKTFIDDGYAWMRRVVTGDTFEPSGGTFNVALGRPDGTRSHAVPEPKGGQSGGVFMGRLDVGVFVHEVVHVMEYADRRWADAAAAHLRHRWGTDKPRRMRDITGVLGYGLDEWAIEDKFFNAYVGKIYEDGFAYGTGATPDPSKPLRFTELLTMALQSLYEDPYGLARKDPDTFRFIVRLLYLGPDRAQPVPTP